MTAVLDPTTTDPATTDPYASYGAGLYADAAAPPALCASWIGARRMRVTLLDSCGRPLWGPRSQVVTDGFVSIEIEPEVVEGEDYKQVNANGDLCVNDRGLDSISWWNLTIEFCRVDPDLFLMMQSLFKRNTDASRKTTTGWRMGEKITGGTAGYALEVWPKNSGAGAAQACVLGASNDATLEPGGYILMSYVISGAPEALTLENKPTLFKLKGRTKAGSLWGRGPYLVTRDENGEPSRLLDPIDPGFDVPAWGFVSDTERGPDHVYTDIVTVRPPSPLCGAQPLWNPDAVTPTIVAAADGTNTRTAVLTVANFNLVGKSGTVQWGDGTDAPMPASSGGVLKKAAPYDPGLDGKPQTITFLAGNGHAPVTTTFTPTAPAQATTDESTEDEPDSGSGTSGRRGSAGRSSR